MKAKLKRYHKNAVVPKKAYDKDFCYDVYATSEEEIAPNVWKYGLGWGMQIERRLEDMDDFLCLDFGLSPLNLSIDFRPRSSVWKTGMVLSNCEGTIDEGYINEVSAVFYHVMPTMQRYRIGDRIGQIKIGVTFPIEFEEVEELNETERGLRGYGSSGK